MSGPVCLFICLSVKIQERIHCNRSIEFVFVTPRESMTFIVNTEYFQVIILRLART